LGGGETSNDEREEGKQNRGFAIGDWEQSIIDARGGHPEGEEREEKPNKEN